jgi:hypothetical protein
MPAPKPVRVIDPHRTQLVIVGVGGTGLYVLQQAARLLYGLRVLGRRVPEVLLIDGDVVEPKNLVRDYFLEQICTRTRPSSPPSGMPGPTGSR